MDVSAQNVNGTGAAEKAAVWRVLIVDDHPMFRDGLRRVLESFAGLVICGEAEHEEGAFLQFARYDANFVTVDISLAAGNGLDLISRIKERRPSAIVLAISMYEDSIYADLALAAGASGYVCKHASSDELRAAVQAVLRGEVYVSPDAAGQRSERKAGSASLSNGLGEKRLSSRELQIFTLIGQGHPTPQIAEELGLAVSTVETYRERLKAKLGLSSGSELTRHAILWTLQKT
jgi:DNA-binding NarL/FixJ family response regulator